MDGLSSIMVNEIRRTPTVLRFFNIQANDQKDFTLDETIETYLSNNFFAEL